MGCCSYLTTLSGFLKILSLILCIIAASLGSSAYYLSEYNKTCGNGTLIPESTFIGKQNEQTTPPAEEEKDMAPVLWMERFQISITWICVIVSLILLLLCLCKESLEYNKIFKAVNFTFHFIGCVLLLVAGICIAFAALEIDRQICQGNYEKREDCQLYIGKLSAAGFTLLAGVVYGIISVKVVFTKLYSEV